MTYRPSPQSSEPLRREFDRVADSLKTKPNYWAQSQAEKDANILPFNTAYAYNNPKRYGLSTSATAARNATALNNAALVAAAAGGIEFEIPEGTYAVTTVSMKSGAVFRGAGKTSTVLQSASYPVIKVEDDCTDIGLKRLHIESTLADSTNNNRALFDANNGNIINGCIVDDCQFTALSTGLNGILFKSSDSGFTNMGHSRNIRISRCKFDVGRMGVEFVNHTANATITGVSIAAEAVITADNMNAIDGMLVWIDSITGTGAVDSLNEHFYEVSDTSGTGAGVTFKLKDSSGAYVSTAGGTYTSGGVVAVHRFEEIWIESNNFSESGAVAYGMGVSLSGRGHSCHVINNTFRDNPSYGIEFVGISGSRLCGNIFYHSSGDIFSSSGTYAGKGNIISDNVTVGFAEGRVYLANTDDLLFSENKLDMKGYLHIITTNSKYSNNVIRTQANYAAFINNRAGNRITGNIFDNSLSTNNFSCFRFYDTGCINNFFHDNILKKGTGGVAYDENSGADDNYIGAVYYDTAGVVSSKFDGYRRHTRSVTSSTTCSVTVTFGSPNSWKPYTMLVRAVTCSDSGGVVGAASDLAFVRAVNSTTAASNGVTNLHTDADCVISYAYSTDICVVTVTASASCNIVLDIDVSGTTDIVFTDSNSLRVLSAIPKSALTLTPAEPATVQV